MRSRSALLVSTSLIVAVATAACSGGDDGGGNAACSLEEVRYEGYSTDETCLTLADAEDADAVFSGGPNAPVLVTPTDGGVIPSSAAVVTVQWETPLDLDTTFARRPAPARPAATSWSALAWQALSPVSVAHAHEPPVTGAIHRLRFRGIGGDDAPVDVFTSLLSYTLDAQLLADVKATTGPISIELTSMFVTENRIVDPVTDGPFAMPEPAVVTVE